MNGVPGNYSANTAFITVGASDTDHGEAWFSRKGPLVSVWAPGENVMVQDPEDFSYGSSIAAASVSGLAAYFLGLDGLKRHIPPDLSLRGKYIRALIQLNAYSRVDGGPKIIYNLAEKCGALLLPDENGDVSNQTSKMKRFVLDTGCRKCGTIACFYISLLKTDNSL